MNDAVLRRLSLGSDLLGLLLGLAVIWRGAPIGALERGVLFLLLGFSGWASYRIIQRAHPRWVQDVFRTEHANRTKSLHDPLWRVALSVAFTVVAVIAVAR